MNLSDTCGKCDDFDEHSDGFGLCKAFLGFPYRGNHEPCFKQKSPGRPKDR